MPKRATLIALVTALLAAACAHGPPVSLDVERHELTQRQNEFFGAMAARDADRMARLFADDALLHVANMPPVEGRDAVRRFYANMFGFLSASTATPEALHISAGGDMAYGVGSASNEFRGPQGPAVYAGKYLLVWRKVADEWLVALYGVSSNQPDPGRN
jgi:ketosteroid isomerase-like protein